MNKIHHLYPDVCLHCRHPFEPTEKIPSEIPLRHQTFELPIIEPIKEEYRCHTLLCGCGHSTTAELPPEGRPLQFRSPGARLHRLARRRPSAE